MALHFWMAEPINCILFGRRFQIGENAESDPRKVGLWKQFAQLLAGGLGVIADDGDTDADRPVTRQIRPTVPEI